MGDIIDFMAAIWGYPWPNFGEIRVIRKNVVKQEFFVDLSEAQRYAVMQNSLGWDVYYGVQPRITKSGSAKDTRQHGNVLWLDLDGKTYAGGKGGAFTSLAQIAPSPQIIVDSGHGYHAYWLLNELTPFPLLQEAMVGMEKASLADHCSDAARVLRLPGTDNHKYGEFAPVRLLRFDMMGRRHRLSDFADYIDLAQPELQPVRAVEGVFWNRPSGWNPSREGAEKFPDGTRNNSLARLAGIMVARGLGYDEMLVQLGHENQVRCEPPLPDQEVVAIVRSVQRYRS